MLVFGGGYTYNFRLGSNLYTWKPRALHDSWALFLKVNCYPKNKTEIPIKTKVDLGYRCISKIEIFSSTSMLKEHVTPAETNLAPENRPSQKETSIPTIHFQLLC